MFPTAKSNTDFAGKAKLDEASPGSRGAGLLVWTAESSAEAESAWEQAGCRGHRLRRRAAPPVSDEGK